MRLTNRRELYSAALLMIIGIGTAVEGASYNIGTLDRMGPGYFPVALGILLTLIGALLIATPSTEGEAEKTVFTRDQYRSWALVVFGLVVFIVLGHYLGLVPATFALVFISALADRTNSVKASLLLAAGTTVAAIGIFHYALQMQFPLFRWG